MQVGNLGSSRYSVQTVCFGEQSPRNAAAAFRAGNGDREDSWHLSIALLPSCSPLLVMSLGLPPASLLLGL